MAKFKKLAFLCMALVMTAGFATATACGSGETPQTSSSVEESSEPSSDDGGEDDGGEDDGGEDDGGNEQQGPEVVNKTINVDEATTFDIAANTYIFIQLKNAGEYVFTWDNANVIVKQGSIDVAGGTVVTNGGTAAKFDDPRDLKAGFTLSTADFSAAKVTLTVTKKVAPPQVLTLNENQIETNNEAKLATFTATKAGTYILSAASGETNALVSVETQSGSTAIELPYEFTLEANATITFGVATKDNKDNLTDTINLVLAEKPLEATKFTLKKGDNSIPVTVPEKGVLATFTADVAGKYRVNYTDSNILVRKADGTTEVVSNSEFELKVGESFVLTIFTANGKEGTVTLSIEKYSDDGNWTKNY